MNDGFPFRAFIFTFILFLGACGGSDNSPPDNSTPDTVSGTAQAPSGSIARLAVDKPLMLAALDFFMPPTSAAVTGLSPVANATVELVRIDDDGNQVGAVLASTTTDSSGRYTLELPGGVTASADLVVQIKNSADVPVLRAMVTADTVNIDPVSDFILDTLINDPGVLLANISIETVKSLVQQVTAIDIDFSAITTIEGAEAAIENSSEIIQALSDQIGTGLVSISGSFAFVETNNPGMVVFYADGRYIHWQDCTDSEDGVGVEYGSYDYDGSVFSAAPEVDQNGGCGLSEWQSFPVTVDDEQLVFEDTDSQSPDFGQSISLPRNAGGPGSIIGAWDVHSAEEPDAGLVFYANGNYIQYQPASSDPNCAGGGVEYGTYSFDGSTITGNIIRDDNQSCGLGNGTGGFSFPSVTVANNVITFNDGELFQFDRVGISAPIISFDMTQFKAVSEMSYSPCPGVLGGYEYSFSANAMTLTGIDGWQTPECTLLPSQTFTENLPAAGLDIPFNCTNYPICTQDDFNGEISGTDQDNRPFTSTYSFNSQTNVLTYVKSVEGSIFTEIITIQPLP